MKHQLLVFVSIWIVILFAFLNINLDNPTGLATTNGAKTIDHVVDDFFGNTEIIFPTGTCGTVAKELYHEISHAPIDVTVGFDTNAAQRIATLNFVTHRHERFGTLDLVKGGTLLGGKGANAMINLNAESIVRVPKRTRTNFLSMHLYGLVGDQVQITKGRFATPSIDCVFIAKNGESICDCESYPISGIEVAGITAVRPPDRQIQ